jgi:hypothetical protein
MAELLALDWSEQRVRGIVAREERGGLRVTGGFDEAWPDDALPTANAAAAGRWLGEQIRKAGYTGRDVRVCVPRSSTVVRRLDLPAVPFDELPPMVEMQAATRSASGLEGLALDFVPITEPGAEGGTSVLAATTSRKLLDGITSVCEAAGLRPGWVGLAPLAAAELVATVARRGDTERSLLVAVHDQTLETTLIVGRRVHFTQSTELHADDDDRLGTAIAAAVRRSLVAHGNGLSANALDHVWWLGDAERSAVHREIVSRQLKVPVEAFDPLANDRVRSDGTGIDSAVVGGAVGTLLVASGATVEQLDFLAPRKPPKKVDLKRRRMIVGGVAAAAVLLVLFGWRQAVIWNLDSRVADLQSQEGELAAYIAKRKTIVEEADKVLEWERLRRDWLADVALLEAQLPDRDRAILTEMNVEAGSRPETLHGRITGKGKARSRDEVNDFFNRLSALGYVVRAWKLDASRTGGEYGWEFDLDVSLPDPNVAKANATTSNTERKGASS